MVLTDLILRKRLPISIFTLETGRLHTQTLEMLVRIKQTYDYDVVTYRPEPEMLQTYVQQNGLNAFMKACKCAKNAAASEKVASEAGISRQQSLDHRPTPRAVKHAK